MTLGSDTLGVLEMLRREAESRFTETLRFTREQMVPDANGVEVPTDVDVLPEPIRGRVKFTSQVVAKAETGAQLVTVQQRRVDVAAQTVGLRPGDKCTVTASDVDASLVGSEFLLYGKPDAGQTTAQRWPVTEV